MTETKTKTKTKTEQQAKYPSAVYAAAGVGDFVYEQLRKLQGKAITFGNDQAPQWKRKVADLSAKVDADKVRESVMTGTQVAAEKATKVYETLVARGEKAFQDETPAAAPARTKAQARTEVRTEAKPAAPVAKKAQPRKKPAA